MILKNNYTSFKPSLNYCAKDSSRLSTEKELLEQFNKLTDEKSSDVINECSELNSEIRKDTAELILEVSFSTREGC